MTNVTSPPTSLSRALSSAGAVVVAFELTRRVVVAVLPVWVYAIAAASVLAWVALIALPRRTGPLVLGIFAVMVLAGGLASTATDGVSVASVAVAIISLSRDPRFALSTTILYSALGVATVLLGLFVHAASPLAVLSMEGGVVISFLAGQSRRQFLVAEQQRMFTNEEHARAALLAERQHIAHDIHDVLAHSLGGLVIQLDAVDALLEAGDTEAAAARVRASRRLAADGLSEARRAVAALRDGPVSRPRTLDADELVAGLQKLFAAHRELGGTVDFAEHGARRPVNSSLAAALRRAVQEGMTNARKHAPGQPVTASLDWGVGDVALRLENPVGNVSANRSGGGNGLVGMRSRFAALPGGVATAAVEAGSFVVRVGGETA
ncbi:MAG TPA: histidine kinase [Galbitalea sp.]|jgi:signal transduction histidine kinase